MNRHRDLLWAVLLAACGLSLLARADGEKLRVDTDFPGGNAVVDRIDGDAVHLHQDLRDTAGDWFYWAFRVRGAAGRSLTFHFTKGNVIGVRGPAVSTDGGKTWRWLGPEAVRGAAFRFTIPADAADVRFAFTFPYVGQDLRAFLKRHGGNPHLKAEVLCKTKAGRDAELLLAGRLDGRDEHRVALTCRHHCCETMASFALEGVLDEVLADTADGAWLRGHVAFFVVPLVDRDGVEAGDQGKNRKPRDHNRDYAGDAIHPEVRAIRERLPAWAAGRLRVALDMHCPAIRGGTNETIYFVGGPAEANGAEVGRLSTALEAVQSGPLVFNSRNNLPFGKGWNGPQNYTAGKPFAHWAAGLPGVRLGTTIEIAYANADGKTVTDASARALGRDLARALRKYLEAAEPQKHPPG